MTPVIEFITLELFGVIGWMLLFPVVWVASTPVIFLDAAFKCGGYLAAVGQMHSSLTTFSMVECHSFFPSK